MSQPLPISAIDDITVLIFGASGDLTSRKLIPALYRLYKDGFLSDKSLVVGVARRPKTDESFRAELREALSRAEATAADNWNRYLRSVAEMENVRKRATRDIEAARARRQQ